MSNFTEAQLQELEAMYGLIPLKAEARKVRDGTVRKGTRVWWRGEGGPECVVAEGEHWRNLKEYPNCYSIVRPKIQYVD